MEANIYNIKGETSGKITLPESIFGLKENKDLLHQVVVSMRSNERAGTAHTKFRGEVRGGGKKPWRQKGTGRARHGSTRSPIWVGGGTTHGPRAEKNYAKKINKKMVTKALYVILSAKLRDNEIIFVDSLNFKTPKTKDAKIALSKIAKASGADRIATSKKKLGLVLLPTSDMDTVKSLRNLPSVIVEQWKNLNPLMALSTRYLVIVEPERAIEFFTSKASKKS